MIDKRIIEENIFKIIMLIATVIIFLSLFAIIFMIFYKGLPVMNLKMITETPKGGFYLGKEGGILNAILGSLSIAGASTLLSVIMSLPVVIYINVYLNKTAKLAGLIRLSYDVLCGIPSIVYGAFGLIIMQFFTLRASLLGGIIAVAFLIAPYFSRSIDEVFKMVPHELLDSSYALGSTKYEVSFKIIIRQCFPGIIMAILLSFGRGIGDAASVLFTAGFSDYIPNSLFRPVATLPLAVFFQLASPIPEVQSRAYASALILTIIILIISITARLISAKFKKYIIK